MDLSKAELRRAKWLFAAFLCPACAVGFLWSLGGIALGGAWGVVLASKGAFILGAAIVAAAIAALVVVLVRRRRKVMAAEQA